jgi:hypothetical protein
MAHEERHSEIMEVPFYYQYAIRRGGLVCGVICAERFIKIQI